jgi:hypothetical protein
MGALDSNVVPGYRWLSVDENNVWSSAGGLAVKESLSLGSLDGVLDVLRPMSAMDMASTLMEAGFAVGRGVMERGQDAVLESVLPALSRAADLRVDGYDLKAADELSVSSRGLGEGIANEDPLASIRRVFQSPSVQVHLFGDAAPGERGSLLFVAGQAMEKNVLGFGFEGIPGKYVVPLKLAEIQQLHRDAAEALAVHSARVALGSWVDEKPVGAISELVPDSVQRLLYGSVSVPVATTIVDSIENGLIGKHAAEIGDHFFSRVMMENGVDVNAPTVDTQAKMLGLVIVEADMERGQYVGPVVGSDHSAVLIKSSRDKCVKLELAGLDKTLGTPGLGDTVRLKYKSGDLTVSMSQKPGREVVGR